MARLQAGWGRRQLLHDCDVVHVDDALGVADDNGDVKGVAFALRIDRHGGSALPPLRVRQLARAGVPQPLIALVDVRYVRVWCRQLATPRLCARPVGDGELLEPPHRPE